MRKATLAFLTFSAIMTHAQTTSPAPVGENPFFSEYTTVYGTIPFTDSMKKLSTAELSSKIRKLKL